VGFERVDVAECRIIYACSWMTVMQYLAHLVAAGAHDLKPALCYRSQLTGMFVHPDLDRWISLNSGWETHKLSHGKYAIS
jgi:hypothetical protein